MLVILDNILPTSNVIMISLLLNTPLESKFPAIVYAAILLANCAAIIGNISLIRTDEMQYLTAKKLNKSDDKIIAKFDQLETEVVDEEKGIHSLRENAHSVRINSHYIFIKYILQERVTTVKPGIEKKRQTSLF